MKKIQKPTMNHYWYIKVSRAKKLYIYISFEDEIIQRLPESHTNYLLGQGKLKLEG